MEGLEESRCLVTLGLTGSLLGVGAIETSPQSSSSDDPSSDVWWAVVLLGTLPLPLALTVDDVVVVGSLVGGLARVEVAFSAVALMP